MGGKKAYPTAVVLEAERMYVREGLEIPEIQARTGISRRTLYLWAKKRNWSQRRQDWIESTGGAVERLMKLISETIREMRSLDSKNVDKLIKAGKLLQYLGQRLDPLGATLLVVEELNLYLRRKSPALHDELKDLIPDFLAYMRDKYRDGVIEGLNV